MIRALFVILILAFSLTAKSQPEADSVLNFIRQNPSKSALYLVVNNTATAALNENKPMPLASTVKWLIALEWAKQCAAGILNAEERIPLAHLENYHIPFTDGMAHPAWLSYIRKQQGEKTDSVSLLEVAKGMMMFSSNANADYLLERVGIHQVYSNTTLLGMKHHSKLHPFAASLFIYQNPAGKKEKAILQSIKKMDEESYLRYIDHFHKGLTADSNFRKKFRPQDLTMPMQKVWSDRLPSASAKDYAILAHALNNRKYFSEETYRYLSMVAETIMEVPGNREWLQHAGSKGGSTPYVITKCLYLTTLKETRIEMTCFFNDLTIQENQRLLGWMNAFEYRIIVDDEFRKAASGLRN